MFLLRCCTLLHVLPLARARVPKATDSTMGDRWAEYSFLYVVSYMVQFIFRDRHIPRRPPV